MNPINTPLGVYEGSEALIGGSPGFIQASMSKIQGPLKDF